MTARETLRRGFGPLVLATLVGILLGALLNPPDVIGQTGNGVAPKGGVAHRLAALEKRVTELEKENAEQDELIADLLEEQLRLTECVRELKERLARLEELVAELFLQIAECCDNPPVGCTDAADCDDGNPCTIDYCDGDTGECIHEPVADGTLCPDGVCEAGECVSSEPPCDNPTTWYLDDDADGYGSEFDRIESCEQPAGYARISGDCDDSDPSVYPGASEVLDRVDNDCDGEVDEGLTR